MTVKLVVGIDGHETGSRALDYGKRMAGLIGDCELLVAYIIEWSPYSFQTQEENAERHKRREEEIATAKERIIDPAVKALVDAGVKARGIVRHGNVADALDAICVAEKADQIIVSRSSEGGIAKRIFGSSTANLVMGASVPVTVVG
ncbi:MAG: universal stress protein [Hyphomicrobiales bacterium]|nr:MAG: universal stress protein [Hyphomicrobiales bacterium]